MDPIRKIRADSRLSRLPSEQQDEVVAHCEGVKLEDGVLWLKSRFNITISNMGLSRWLAHQRARRPITARLDQIRQARDQAMFIGNVVGSAAEINGANVALIAQAVFEELLKPEDERDEDQLRKYMSLGLQLRGLDLKSRSIDITHERFHFDAAKTVLANAAQLQRINESGADERTKIEQAMALLFGKPVTVED